MGAGGKATLMKRLILEAQKSDSPILVTGTTNLHSFKNSTGLQTISGYEGIKVSQKDEKILWAKKNYRMIFFMDFLLEK